MAKEAELVTDTKTVNRIQFSRPDFSVFDKKVLGWNLSMSNDIDDEDTLTITFAGLPKYNNQPIYKRQLLEFGSGTDLPFKMLVRNIEYQAQNGRDLTTLNLATQKILFDNFISTGWALPESTQAPDLTQVMDDLTFNVLILDVVELDIDSSIKFPLKQARILGNKNVLDYLKDVFSQDGGKLINWWIDAFNILHMQKTNGFNSTAIEIDYENIRSKLNSLRVIVQDKWEEKEIKISANLNDPNTAPPQKIQGLELSLSGNDVSIRNKTIKSRTGTQGGTEQENPALQNVAVDDTEIKVEVLGIHWILPHNRVNLTNFPIGNGSYKVNKLEINDRGTPSTVITLKTVGFDMLQKLKPATEETKKNPPPKKQKGVEVILEGETVRTQPAVR